MWLTTRQCLQPTLLNVSTPNTVPPVYTVAAVGSFVEGQAQLTVATDEPAYSRYVVELSLNPNRPSPDQVQTLLPALQGTDLSQQQLMLMLLTVEGFCHSYCTHVLLLVMLWVLRC